MLSSVLEVSREYEVSTTAVYKWLHKYSRSRKRGIKQVVELMSDTRKIQELKERIRELEQMLSQKQFEIEFKEKMIDIAEEVYNIDIKKKTWFTTITWFWLHRKEYSWKMNQFVPLAGASGSILMLA